MRVRFDFAKTVRGGLRAGRKSCGDLEEMHALARRMADTVESQVRKEFNVPVKVEIKSSLCKKKSPKWMHRFWEDAMIPRDYSLTVKIGKCKDRVLLAVYRPDSLSSYPCTIRNGADCLICSNIGQFSSGLETVVSDRAKQIGGLVRDCRAVKCCTRSTRKKPISAKKRPVPKMSKPISARPN